MIHYSEIAPSTALQPYVDRYFSFTADPQATAAETQVCWPHDTLAWIIRTGAGMTWFHGEHKIALPDSYLMGFRQLPLYWTLDPGTSVFGVSLRPEALQRFWNLRPVMFHRTLIPTDSIHRLRLRPVIAQMPAANPDLQAMWMNEFLGTCLETSLPEENQLHRALRLIREYQGELDLDTLCAKVYLGERQLQRIFKSVLGIGPKSYMRLVRFNQAFELRRSNLSCTDISYHLGYTDIAHFNRDFKTFAGVAPSVAFASLT